MTRSRRQHRSPSFLAFAVLCAWCWGSAVAYDSGELDDNDLHVLDKKLPYGGDDCCDTAYPDKDPLPRVSVILQYFKMAPNIDVLARWKECPGVEFIVNVDSDQEEDREWLSKGVDHVVFSNNIHETRAYNKLARMSRAPIVFFVQDDDPPYSDCSYIEHVEKMFTDDAKLSVVGFNVGTNTPWDHKWESPDGVVDHIRSHDATHKWGLGNFAAEYAACVDIGPFVVRRRDFLAMGGFDESFSYPGKGAMGLDFDIATRAWLSGHTVAKYDPSKSGVDKHKGMTYPSGEGGLRAKAQYYDKDNVERGARTKAFARYLQYYDRISALVQRKNKGLKPWGPEDQAAARQHLQEAEEAKKDKDEMSEKSAPRRAGEGGTGGAAPAPEESESGGGGDDSSAAIG